MTTVLITGANRGIGLEFVRQYAADGTDVIACCRAPSDAAELKTVKGKVRVQALEVTDDGSVAALAGALKGMAIDILINNAGLGSRESARGRIDSAAWLKLFAVNSVAPVAVSAALLENLKAGKDKKLVTITSQLGSIANHGGGAFPYHASKAAVNSFMHGLSRSLAGDGIAVGIFHPGWVKTDMGGQSAPVTPEQSVAGLRARIAELSLDNSGSFRDFSGKTLPW
jgi:NAD(P)-dependent dehydrogenase (short-subunit alcohol dehydrogenase family)